MPLQPNRHYQVSAVGTRVSGPLDSNVNDSATMTYSDDSYGMSHIILSFRPWMLQVIVRNDDINASLKMLIH